MSIRVADIGEWNQVLPSAGNQMVPPLLVYHCGAYVPQTNHLYIFGGGVDELSYSTVNR